MKKHITSPQAAAILGVSPETMKTWRRRGKGPEPVRQDSRVYYVESEVRRWMRKRIRAV